MEFYPDEWLNNMINEEADVVNLDEAIDELLDREERGEIYSDDEEAQMELSPRSY